MQLVINVLYGLPIGVGLFLIGVPNALLWEFSPLSCASFPISARSSRRCSP